MEVECEKHKARPPHGTHIPGTCLKLTCFQSSRAALWSILTWRAHTLSMKDHCWDLRFLIHDLSPNRAICHIPAYFELGSRLKEPDSRSPSPPGAFPPGPRFCPEALPCTAAASCSDPPSSCRGQVVAEPWWPSGAMLYPWLRNTQDIVLNGL